MPKAARWGKSPARTPGLPGERVVYTSADEHPALTGLPDGWTLEVVPRATGGEVNWWCSPVDPRTGKPSMLRSLNEVANFLKPEAVAAKQAKYDELDREQVKKTLEALLAKVERVSSGKPPRHRSPKPSASKPAAGADAAGGDQTAGSADAQAKRPGRPRAAVKSAIEIMREPLSAFMLFGLEQHSLDPPAPTADPRELVKGYGEEWLKLSPEARLPWEHMAEGLEPPRCKRMAEDKAKKKLAGGKGSTGGKAKVVVDHYAPTFSDSAQRRAGKSAVESTSPPPAAPLFGDEPAHPDDDFDDELEGDEPELPSGDGDAMDADADAMEV